jgi:ABC-type tungstate transport system substrate-binding protein
MNAFEESLGLALQMIGSADPALWSIVGLSLRVSATACALGAGVGLLLGAWLAVARFPGHALVVGAGNTLLALPSVVVGWWSTCCCRARGRWGAGASCSRRRPWSSRRASWWCH